jgi:hypothetical protein
MQALLSKATKLSLFTISDKQGDMFFEKNMSLQKKYSITIQKNRKINLKPLALRALID